jgi:predicted CXXCH cytochrome family protein
MAFFLLKFNNKNMKARLFIIMLIAGILFYKFINNNISNYAIASEGCVTEKCHPSLLKSKNIHPVAYTCESCHQKLEETHPKKGQKTFALIQEGKALCDMCHSNVITKKIVHMPVKDGMCTTCHNPHDSDEQRLLQQPLGSLCTNCHPSITEHKNLHGPVAANDCLSCHSAHDSDYERLTLKKDAEICTVCHVDVATELKKKVIHPALLGGCTSCHNPHGSPFKKFFSVESNELCFQCHPSISDNMQNARSIHAPIKSEKSCASCHSAHTSEAEKLLPKTEGQLCLDCHKDIIKKNYTILHGPIKDGKCTPCHNPHSSTQERLLVKKYSTDEYIPYSDKEYELCFNCHNRELLRFPETSFATGFRDGEKNLHFVHVNKKDKGRNCKLCHTVHGGTLPKLIAENVSFGKWKLPLKFVKTETGGSCTPGCHRTFNYDRKTPGKAPELEKTTDKNQEKRKRQ